MPVVASSSGGRAAAELRASARFDEARPISRTGGGTTACFVPACLLM
eukprot:CAMPEP_0118983914 /NCGR_PEP_ID=MMETSP1173-20130426/36660_1 /TAXON_ID=1034831 /ORGANISM="Rhizochromulina marina cf, Strain CCMP1243" /LENGTH=46 /DNA_ID= /DNA_START= /DNA_END= /DNA_ORIENTATION=